MIKTNVHWGNDEAPSAAVLCRRRRHSRRLVSQARLQDDD